MMEKQELIINALREAKDFAKDMRKYLYEQEQSRPLTEQEKIFFDKTHDIHIHTNDALMFFDKPKEFKRTMQINQTPIREDDGSFKKTDNSSFTYLPTPELMYELVKNIPGEMTKLHTGYFTDTETEMRTVLNYLNLGDETGITEGMKDQINKAIRDMEAKTTLRRD